MTSRFTQAVTLRPALLIAGIMLLQSVGLGNQPDPFAPEAQVPDETPRRLAISTETPLAGCQEDEVTNQEDRPRLVLNTGGPIGVVWTLAFSPDSQRIYSGGFDKSVQVWGLHEQRSIRRTAGNTATLMQTLRWEIARGVRGVVYAVAVNPVEERLAIAGLSARDQTGDILVYDAGTYQVDRLLRHHGSTVSSLHYSPDGKHLVSSSIDGEVVLWSAPNWEARVLRGKQAKDLPMVEQPAAFLDNATIAISQPAENLPNQWNVALIDLSNPAAAPRRLPQLHGGKITSLVRNPHGAGWASADKAGNVFVWESARAAAPRLLRKYRVATSLAFAPGNRLFVATMLDPKRQAVLELWDYSTGQLVDQMQTATAANNYACAVSPDGSRVVTYGGDENELYVLLLKERDGTVIPKPLAGSRVLRLRGTGRKVWKVAFDADGSYRLALGTERKPVDQMRINDQGNLTVAFDLANPNILRFKTPGNPNAIIPPEAARKIMRAGRDDVDPSDRVRWSDVDDFAKGWTVQIQGRVLQLLENGQPRGRVSLEKDGLTRAVSYCWVNRPDGEPFAIAVGLDRGGLASTGIVVYKLVAEGDCPILRYFRDHVDLVPSLSVSKDGKYLASCSLDQTVKIWSLAGLTDPPTSFPRSVGWGASFALQNGQVVATDVLPASIATNRGLKEGDRILMARTIKEKMPVDVSDPNEILSILSKPLWETQILTIEREGKKLDPILLVPGWEPVMTLFIDTRDEWALWTPHGYYDASVSGDELFGWQVNQGFRNKPDFFRADQFRRQLERPDVLRRLLPTGNVQEALQAANQQIPANLNSVLGLVGDLAGTTPIVTILEPRDGIQVGQQASVRVVAQVDYPTDELANQFRVKAFVNGVPGSNAQVQGAGRQQTVQWDLPAPGRFNRVRVLAEEGEEEDAPFAFSDVHVQATPEEAKATKPKLHIFAMAAGDYQGDLALTFPVKDATSIVEYLETWKGEFYDKGTIRILKDAEITRSAVDEVVAEFTSALKDADPEDLFVIFVAGHGIAFDSDYYFVPPDSSISEFDEAVIKKIGISWAQLRGLSGLGCRKIFMLDTCFSGNILLAEGGAQNWKSSIRPLGRDEVLVLSATDVNQPAMESRKLEHGIFTRFVLNGLEGKADGVAIRGDRLSPRDNYVDLLEVAKYVEQAVPEYTGALQTPRSTPIELLELVFVPLVEVPSQDKTGSN